MPRLLSGLLLLALVVVPDGAWARKFTHGTFAYDLPDGWKHKIEKKENRQVVTASTSTAFVSIRNAPKTEREDLKRMLFAIMVEFKAPRCTGPKPVKLGAFSGEESVCQAIYKGRPSVFKMLLVDHPTSPRVLSILYGYDQGAPLEVRNAAEAVPASVRSNP